VLSRDIKGIVSILVYLAAIGLAFLDPLFSFALYVVVAILWFIPDKRLEDPFFEPKNK
jgi:hypothetical protein